MLGYGSMTHPDILRMERFGDIDLFFCDDGYDEEAAYKMDQYTDYMESMMGGCGDE